MRTLFFVLVFLFISLYSFAHDNGLEEKLGTTEKGFALAKTQIQTPLFSTTQQLDYFKARRPRK